MVGAADANFTTQVRDRQASFDAFQGTHDLAVGKPRFFSCRTSFVENSTFETLGFSGNYPATDTRDLAHSQKLLAHKNRDMTEHYVKARMRKRVKPLR